MGATEVALNIWEGLWLANPFLGVDFYRYYRYFPFMGMINKNNDRMFLATGCLKAACMRIFKVGKRDVS